MRTQIRHDNVWLEDHDLLNTQHNASLIILLATCTIVPCAAVVQAAAPDNVTGIIITEIMYNPASKESTGQTEWIEIANITSEPVELNDWRFDDEDDNNWGTFSCTIAPGGIVVIINSDAVTEDEFRTAWDTESSVPSIESGESGESAAEPAYQIIAVTWGSLSNSASETNEILQLLDEHDDIICEVNYQRAGDWPDVRRPDGSSIWLSDLSATDFNLGELWKRSEDGLNGARNATSTPIFSAADVGSPGFVEGLGELMASQATEPNQDNSEQDDTAAEPKPKPKPDPESEDD